MKGDMKIKYALIYNDEFFSVITSLLGKKMPISALYNYEKCMKLLGNTRKDIFEYLTKLYSTNGIPVYNENGEIVRYVLDGVEDSIKQEVIRQQSEFLDLELELPVQEKIKLNVHKIDLEVDSKGLSILGTIFEFVES